jgi:20S proteasome alpha/beta subunit
MALSTPADSINPRSISHLLSALLYQSNLICSPIVAGLSREGPYIASLDGLGAITNSNSFVVSGTSSAGLYAILESLYAPNLDAEELVGLATKAFTLAMQRDVLSGCKVRIFSITRNGIYEKLFQTDDV